MAFPYIIDVNFDDGTLGAFTSESDSATRLDYPHWSTLVQTIGALPWRGAYCMRVALGSATAAKVISTAGDIADGSTAYVRFMLYLGKDVAFTADDTLQICEFTQAAGSTVEASISLRFTNSSQLIEIGVSDGITPITFAAAPLVRDRWYQIECECKISTSDAGTMKLYVDGSLQVSLASLDAAAAVGDVTLGVVGCATTTTGTLLFDKFVFDDTRIYPIMDRYTVNRLLTKTEHLFVGPGFVQNITLWAGAAADNTVTVYDTDRANVNDLNKVVAYLANVTASDVVDVAGLPVQVNRGAYAVLGGTNPRAVAIVAPYAMDDSALREQGMNHRPISVLAG